MKHKFFNIAESISKLSDYNRIHIGCVIVKNNDIISVGYNQLKTHPIQNKYNKHFEYPHLNDYMHAEMNAIIKAKSASLKGATMYIFRKNLNGQLSICKPCTACIRAIKDAGIKEVYYTIENGYSYQKVG